MKIMPKPNTIATNSPVSLHPQKDVNKAESWEIEFDKNFSIDSFTWNGDFFHGLALAKSTRNKIKSFIRKTRQEAVEEALKKESIAWCECGDALETKMIMSKLNKPVDFGTGKGIVTEIIDHYEYYCFGCDKTYILKLKEEHDN